MSFQGDLEAGVSATLNDLNTQTIKDIETEVIHGEAFDKFMNYIVENNLIVEANYKVGDYIEEVINALKSLLPYKKIIMSDDFFIATSDKFFREKTEMIGFKYGEEISFVGYITNKVTYDNNEVPNDIPLSSIKNLANNAILNVLGKGKEIHIVHPITIYYE